MDLKHLRAFKTCERRAMLLDNLVQMSPQTTKATDEDCQEMYDLFCVSVGSVVDDETVPANVKHAVSLMKGKVDNIIVQSGAIVQLQIA